MTGMDTNEYYAAVQRAADSLRERGIPAPEVGIVLGSGLGGVAEHLEGPRSVPFAELPGMPRSRVPGHAGRFVLGALGGVPVVLQEGRVHRYEGWTAREVARLKLDAVKIHNLYAVKRTPLADQVARGEVTLMGRDDYIATLVDFLELLPPSMIVERISGDAPPDYFIGPSWCLDKPAVKRAIDAEFERRDTWQGKLRTPEK